MGPPLGPVPAAVMAYEVAGFSPVRAQVDEVQVAMMGEPPPTSTAVRV